MKAHPTRVLVVDKNQRMLQYIRSLAHPDLELITTESAEESLSFCVEEFTPDIVLMDEELFFGSPEFVEQAKQLGSRVNIVVMVPVTHTDAAIHAIAQGASHILWKPFRVADLDEVVSAVVDETAPSDSLAPQCIEIDSEYAFVFASPAMQEIYSASNVIGRVDVPVLLLGESGTGKEVLAHYLHSVSPRARQPFHKINCAAMPADLLESELFGYEAGAFTGANKAKPGKFELCNKSTILLDEIGEMHPNLQAKLLHVLQDGTFTRLGGRTTIKVDVRVIAATNVDIHDAIARKQFREDLYYRLNGFSVCLPPLRKRKEEIPALLNHFITKSAVSFGRPPVSLSKRMLGACLEYDWPGNIRELENFVKRFFIFQDEPHFVAELQSNQKRTESPAKKPALASKSSGNLKKLVRNAKDDVETQAIVQALEAADWNRKQAAAELGISYKALLYKVRQHGLTPPWVNYGS
jgi:two-component system response regulator AtoC